jgi:sigma-B regulation protein RsbQ
MPINDRRSDAASSGVERVDEVTELRRRIDRRARAPDPFGQPGIRSHDVDLVGAIVGADQPDDLIIRRIRCGLGRVTNCDGRRPNRRRTLEDHGHNMGVRRSPPVELFDQPSSGALTVLPPAIRPSPDHVHRVHDPPHHTDGTDAHRWQYEGVNLQVRNNVRLAGVEDGPTIMLAHGFGCDQHLWRLIEERLAASFRLILFDHVGCGASDPSAWDPKRYATLQGYADDILGIVRELDVREVVFVGHSVAAMMGVLAVSTDPSRFSRLVLLTPSPCYLDSGDYRGGFSRTDIDELLDSLERNYLGWSRSMAPVIMGTPDRPELSDELTDSFCRTDPACARVFARTTFLSDNRADLARVSVPTLVIECAHDTLAPRAVGAYVQQRIDGSELVTLDAVGHCPQLSAPDITAQAIAAFAGAT